MKFPTQPISIVCALILFAMPTMNLGRAFARDDASMTYRCTAKDAVGIQGDGTLKKDDPGAEIQRQYFSRVVINVRNGHIADPSSGKLESWIVRKTSATGDYVLIPSSSFRGGKTAANATTTFIRLRAGTDKQQALFMAFLLSYLITGTCEIAR